MPKKESPEKPSAQSPSNALPKQGPKRVKKKKKQGTPGKGQPKPSLPDTKQKKRKVPYANESVESFAEAAEARKTGWFETWNKPAWMPAFTLDAPALAEMVKFQADMWANQGVPSDPLDLNWSEIAKYRDVTPADVTLCFLTGMAVADKDIREVFKLTAQFVDVRSFIGAVEQALVDGKVHARYDYSTPFGAVLALCYAPAKLRRVVREIGQSLMKKEAKMPEDVSQFEAEVGAINSSLKACDRKFQLELKTLQDAVKRKLQEKETFEKQTSEFRHFIKEYYGVRSGKVDANVKQKLVVMYNARETLRSKYSLEQFINLYGQTTALKRVQSKLDHFRAHEGFKAGCQWLENQSQDSQDEVDGENEEMEDDKEAEVDDDAIRLLDNV